MSKKIFKKSIASIFVAVILIVTLMPLSSLSGVGTATYGGDEDIEYKVSPLKSSYTPAIYSTVLPRPPVSGSRNLIFSVFLIVIVPDETAASFGV